MPAFFSDFSEMTSWCAFSAPVARTDKLCGRLDTLSDSNDTLSQLPGGPNPKSCGLNGAVEVASLAVSCLECPRLRTKRGRLLGGMPNCAELSRHRRVSFPEVPSVE